MFERKVMAAIARSVALVKCILCAPEGEVDRPGGLARIEAESLEADWVSHASVEISLHVREVNAIVGGASWVQKTSCLLLSSRELY